MRFTALRTDPDALIFIFMSASSTREFCLKQWTEILQTESYNSGRHFFKSNCNTMLRWRTIRSEDARAKPFKYPSENGFNTELPASFSHGPFKAYGQHPDVPSGWASTKGCEPEMKQTILNIETCQFLGNVNPTRWLQTTRSIETQAGNMEW